MRILDTQLDGYEKFMGQKNNNTPLYTGPD